MTIKTKYNMNEKVKVEISDYTPKFCPTCDQEIYNPDKVIKECRVKEISLKDQGLYYVVVPDGSDCGYLMSEKNLEELN